MKIGDLSRTFDVPVETVRYYEREGLLPAPARTAGNYRIYSPAYADRLRFIVNCRALDMTLDEIRTLLEYHDRPQADCGDVATALDEHLAHVTKRMAELKRLDRQLRALRHACRDRRTHGECGILASLKRDSIEKAASRRRKGI